MKSGRSVILFRYYQVPDISKLSITDAGDGDQVLRLTKGPVVFAVFDNPSGKSLPYARQLFQFFD
jgi:hypothetical protein